MTLLRIYHLALALMTVALLTMSVALVQWQKVASDLEVQMENDATDDFFAAGGGGVSKICTVGMKVATPTNLKQSYDTFWFESLFGPTLRYA
jgi:hypothetical protein